MCRILHRVFAPASLVLIFWSSCQVEAQMPVAVSFELDLPAMTSRWEAGQAEATADQLREHLAEYLGETFEFWQFVEVEAGAPARLEFRLAEGGPNVALLELATHFASERRAHQKLSEVLWGPLLFGAEIGAPREEIAEQLPDALAERLIEPHQQVLESWLKTWVPIGGGGEWDESADSVRPPLLLLPLRSQLNRSYFRLLCNGADGASAVYTVGTGADRPAPTGETQGLVQVSPRVVTLPRRLEVAGDCVDVRGPAVETVMGTLELIELEPQSVFLMEYVPRSTLMRLDTTCGGAP